MVYMFFFLMNVLYLARSKNTFYQKQRNLFFFNYLKQEYHNKSSKLFNLDRMKTLLVTPAKLGKSWLTIIMAGLIAGTLDALAAVVVYSIPPVSLFQFIASAAFGQIAFTGLSPYVWWGILFHYLI